MNYRASFPGGHAAQEAQRRADAAAMSETELSRHPANQQGTAAGLFIESEKSASLAFAETVIVLRDLLKLRSGSLVEFVQSHRQRAGMPARLRLVTMALAIPGQTVQKGEELVVVRSG